MRDVSHILRSLFLPPGLLLDPALSPEGQLSYRSLQVLPVVSLAAALSILCRTTSRNLEDVSVKIGTRWEPSKLLELTKLINKTGPRLD